MSLSRSSLRSPLAKVRGLGPAREGARHWWVERMTSLALIPLSVWFLVGLIGHIGLPHEELATWLSAPLVSVLLAALMLVIFLHTKMGIQAIIDDYVHHEGHRIAVTLFKDIVIYALAAATILALLKLQFVGVK